MKLCIVVPYFTPFVRGNEYGLAEVLTKLGYDVTIIASKGKAPREVKKVFSGDYAFKVKYLPTRLDIGENPFVYGLRLEGYEVALLQEDYPFICHKAYMLAKKKRIKTVLSVVRGYYPRGYKGVFLKLFDHFKNKELREGADIVTARCSVTKEFMEDVLRVSREIEIMYSGVDTGLFKPQAEPSDEYLTEGEFKILTTARLHRYKGLEYLIEAIGLLQEIRDVKLYILGKGNEERNLKELARRLNLERTVEFMDKPVPNHRMPLLYGDCDIYVQSSINEPYGIAVLEAMACGKPVIGTKVGGMLDTIKDGETGFLVEPKNAGEIAGRIETLRNEKRRAEMGKKGREWVVENFDWTVIGKQYQKIIDKLA